MALQVRVAACLFNQPAQGVLDRTVSVSVSVSVFMSRFPDAWPIWSRHTRAPRSTLNRPPQAYHENPSLVQKPKEHAWTSCSICAVPRSTSTRQWSRHSLPTLARPSCMANAKKRKSSTGTRINLATFILETTGRRGYHAQEFIKHLFSDTDHPPTSRPHCTTVSQNNGSEPSPCDTLRYFRTTPRAYLHPLHHPA